MLARRRVRGAARKVPSSFLQWQARKKLCGSIVYLSFIQGAYTNTGSRRSPTPQSHSLTQKGEKAHLLYGTEWSVTPKLGYGAK